MMGSYDMLDELANMPSPKDREPPANAGRDDSAQFKRYVQAGVENERLRSQLAAQSRRIEALEGVVEAVKEYAHVCFHSRDCALLMSHYDRESLESCDCGYDEVEAALARLDEVKEST